MQFEIKTTPTESTSSNQRNSSMELLRIIAIILICLSHAYQTSQKFFDYSINDLRWFSIIGYTGQIGNMIFVFCSAYFLCSDNCIKLKKIAKLLLDSMTISIIICLIFLITGAELSAEIIVKQFLPDLFFNNWFIPTYLILYILHPLLNYLIDNSPFWLQTIVCVSILSILSIPTIFISINGINTVLGFVFLYYLTAYTKKNLQNKKHFAIINNFVFVVFIILFIVIKYIEIVNKHYLFTFSVNNDFYFSPILVISTLSLFFIFTGFAFYSKIINYLSTCTLFVYLIHENFLLRRILRPKFFAYIIDAFPNQNITIVIICSIAMLVSSYILAIIYKHTMSKVTNIISSKLDSLSHTFYPKS